MRVRKFPFPELFSPGPEPEPDDVRFKACAVCGQVCDMQSHHDARPHASMRAF